MGQSVKGGYSTYVRYGSFGQIVKECQWIIWFVNHNFGGKPFQQRINILIRHILLHCIWRSLHGLCSVLVFVGGCSFEDCV